jgi:hypothetical protein
VKSLACLAVPTMNFALFMSFLLLSCFVLVGLAFWPLPLAWDFPLPRPLPSLPILVVPWWVLGVCLEVTFLFFKILTLFTVFAITFEPLYQNECALAAFDAEFDSASFWLFKSLVVQKTVEL